MHSKCSSDPKRILLCISLFNRPYQPTNSQEHITLVEYVHTKLATICSESGLEGIHYIGGPFCPYCQNQQVLHLVQYQKGRKDCYQNRTKIAKDPQKADKLMIRCGQCCKDSNLYELLSPDTKCHPGL